MTERGPINQDRLTTQPTPPKLEVRRDIFMAEPGGGEAQPGAGGAQQPPTERPGASGGSPAAEQERIAREALRGLTPPQEGASPEEQRAYELTRGALMEAAGRTLAPGTVSRPDFRSILEGTDPQTAFRLLSSRYDDVSQDLLRRLGSVPDDDATQRTNLSSEFERLSSEYEAARNLLVMSAEVPERSISEAEKRDLDQIEAMARGPERGGEIRKFMEKYIEHVSPEDEPLPDRVLKLIAQDDGATDEFITRLIVSDLENEPWQIRGFYGNINFEKFRQVTQSELSGDRRDRLLALIDANSSFHNMNYILKRNFEQFSQQSEAILPRHLEVLANVPGVAAALSLYEEYYAAALSKDTRLTEESAMAIDKKVDDALKQQAKTMIGITGEVMASWEVRRAFVYARNFFRITVRAAEHTTLSQLPEHDDPLIYVSSPQAKLTQVLNVLKFVGFRFRPEEQMGGPELLDRTLDNNMKARQKRVRIKTLQGTDVDMREFQGIVGARGVFATWRNAEIALRGLKFKDTTGENTNVVQFFLDHSQELSTLKERSDKKPTGKAAEALKADTERLFAPLLDNVTVSLGLLASPSGLGGNATAEFKQLVWERIAKLDPLVMASLLTRLQMDGKSEGMHFIQNGETAPKVQALEDILLSVWGTAEEKSALWGTGGLRARGVDRVGIKDLGIRELRTEIETRVNKPDKSKTPKIKKEIDDMRIELNKREAVLKQVLESQKWQELARKLRTAHRLRMNAEEERIRDARLNEKPKTLDSFLEGELALDADEQKVLASIRRNGNEISGDLARIKQTTAWFLDDVPFKTLDWKRLGQFYDRETGDLGNFNKSAGALLKIISNPFGRPTEAVLKDLSEAMSSASMVLGRESAQNNQQPILEAYLEMIYEEPRFRQILIESALHAIHHPTSRAQEIAGMDAPAVSEDGILDILEHALRDGIVRKNVKDEKGNLKWHGTFEDLKKKFHATQLHVLWGRIRDFGPLGIFAFLYQFFKSVASTK